MDRGVACAAGSNRCSAASTSCKSSSKNSGSFILGRTVREFSFCNPGLQPCSSFHHTPLQLRAFITLRSRLPVRTAPPPVCRPLFSAKSQPCPQLLPVVSGTLATAPRLLQKVSSLRPAKVAGFPADAPLLPAVRVNAQNQAFSAVQVFSEQVYSRGLFQSALISISARITEHSNPSFSRRTSPLARFPAGGTAPGPLRAVPVFARTSNS